MVAKPKTPKLSSKELAANYGWALATLNSNAELKKLFQTAVKKQYTPERFIAEMRNLNWFKSSSEAQRKYLVLRTADPAQYVSQVKQLMSSLSDEYGQATGWTPDTNYPRVDAHGKIIDGSGWLFNAAQTALSTGMNENQIRDSLFKSIDWAKKVTEGSLGGSTAGSLQQIRAQAAAFGVQPTDSWYGDRIKDIALGDDTAEGALERIKQMSKQRYSAFASQIDSGQSLDDISEGYRQSMAKVLEINPGQVDVFDNKIQSALTNKNSDGADAPQSIGDFEKTLRQDNRWQYTDNAKDTLLTQGQNVLRSFGLSN